MNRDFKGIFIEREIWECTELSITQKVFIAEIDSLDSSPRRCFASNKYFADFFQLSVKRVSEIINQLVKMGIVCSHIDKDNNNERTLFINYKALANYTEKSGGSIPKNQERVSRKLGIGYPEKSGKGIPKNQEYITKGYNKESITKNDNIEESEIKNFAPTQDEIISFDENGNQITNDSLTEKTKRKQTGRAAFVPPTEGEVYDEAIQKGLTREEARFESSQFVNYYESIGWVRGEGKKAKPIVNWKAAFAGWLNRSAKWNKERKADTHTETSRRDSYADIAEITINSLIK